MNFFKKLYKFVVFPGISAGIRTSAKNLNGMEKFFIFHDQGTFSFIFASSVLLHIFLVIITMVISELWVQELPPIRAKIEVRFAKTPSETAPIEKPKPVLKEIENEWQPKLSNLVPKKPVLEKPVLKDTLKKSTLSKPEITQPEAPRLKMSEPQLAPSVPTAKLNKISAPKKPLLLPVDSLEKFPLIPSLPKLSKDPVPLSPLRSKKSKLNPSQFALPKISLGDITPKKINAPKIINTSKKLNKPKIKNSQNFSKPLNFPVREWPATMESALQKVPSIPQVQPSENLGTNLREIFPDKIKFDEPLPDLGIPEQADETKLKEIPDTVNLQRKKLAQLAGEEYNLHIRTRIIPKLGSYSSELYVRIRLRIIPTGKIINYEIIKKSGFAAFDKAAELAVRNALLDPLPNALAENPPYIVTIRIVPQN
jgi:TonB family protein